MAITNDLNDLSNDDLGAKLARLEAQIEELHEAARELRAGLNDAGPMEPEDRSQAVYEAEQQEAIVSELEMRRDALRKHLGD